MQFQEYFIILTGCITLQLAMVNISLYCRWQFRQSGRFCLFSSVSQAPFFSWKDINLQRFKNIFSFLVPFAATWWQLPFETRWIVKAMCLTKQIFKISFLILISVTSFTGRIQHWWYDATSQLACRWAKVGLEASRKLFWSKLFFNNYKYHPLFHYTLHQITPSCSHMLWFGSILWCYVK